MNNYKEQILGLLDKAFLEKVLETYFEDDHITNKTFRLNSNMLRSKWDPLYFTGMNVIISNLVAKFETLFERNYTILSGDPFKSKFFGIGDYKLLRIRDIKRNYIDYDAATVIPENHYQLYPNSHAHVNDIVIGLDGDEFRAGLIKKGHLPCVINQRVAIIRGLEEELAIFIMLAINSYIGVYQLERVKTYAGTVGHISTGDIKNLRFPIPVDYHTFVSEYKERIDKVSQFVDKIRTVSDNLRIDIYSKLNLMPSEKISEIMNIDFNI